MHSYSQEKIEKAMHNHELTKDEYYSLCIDAKQRGVGGDMPGTACLHEPYKMHSGNYSFAFSIRGIKADKWNLHKGARREADGAADWGRRDSSDINVASINNYYSKGLD